MTGGAEGSQKGTQEGAQEGTQGDSQDRQRLEAEVHGRVQGVGFRYFVQRHATRRRLQGYTRNLSDGRRVEVVAEGERAALEELLAALREGPPGSYVERVTVSWLPASGGFEDFSIRH